MQILRTPEACFEDLPGWPYPPRYTTIQDDSGAELRIHWIDEGPPDAEPILLMHGNPTWAYLYRKMIPGLLATGRRVIAVDLVGCGRSDKPASKDDYTLARHYDWMSKWLVAENLRNITLFCQDWGGTIGLYLVSAFPERFNRVIASNTGLPLGEGGNPALEAWLSMMGAATEFPWAFFQNYLPPGLTPAEHAAYRAPFPDPSYEAGITKFPVLIAIHADNPGAALNRAAWERLKAFHKPFLTLFGANDPVSRGWDKRAQREIPGAAGQDHHLVPEAGHFIQEDAPEEMVRRIAAFLEMRP